MTTSRTETAVEQAVARHARAAATAAPCPPVRDPVDRADVAAAYLGRGGGLDARATAGARRVGRKIGLTGPAVEAQLGMDPHVAAVDA